jgi:hypothetical protein
MNRDLSVCRARFTPARTMAGFRRGYSWRFWAEPVTKGADSRVCVGSAQVYFTAKQISRRKDVVQEVVLAPLADAYPVLESDMSESDPTEDKSRTGSNLKVSLDELLVTGTGSLQVHSLLSHLHCSQSIYTLSSWSHRLANGNFSPGWPDQEARNRTGATILWG